MNGRFPTIFVSGSMQLRAVEHQGAPWFIARDVCAGTGHKNPSMAVAVLAADEKGLKRIDTPGGPQDMLIVSESGLYKLIMRSDKPAARRFQDWVTREVLLALRKDGMYVMGEEKVKTGEMSEDKKFSPGLLRERRNTLPLGLLAQRGDAGCKIYLTACPTSRIVDWFQAVGHMLEQNLEEDQAP